MLIGELSKRSGFSRDTIRYYEKLGLITVGMGRRSDNGYKNYALDVLEHLHQVSRLKECGFTLPEIQRLLINDVANHPCENLPDQLAEKIFKLNEKMAVLMEYKQSLLQIQRSCNGACGTSQGVPDCIPLATDKGETGSCC